MTIEATPLDGIRLLDLGRYQAGPRCALMFARMGAEVIKVESLHGDESRGNGPMVRGQSAYWVQYNSGKKSLAIDLRMEEGKAVLRDLVKVSDVFLQNFRPGTIDAMGFGYEVLRGINPRIVMVNVSAYGQDGPYRDRIGFDPIGQAICGLMQLTGYPDSPPTMTAMPIIDRITALHGTIGVLAALREREISGEGQAIDVSLADTGFSLTEIPIAHYLGTGELPRRQGSRIPGSLTNIYNTSDGWALVISPNQNIWRRLCICLGHPEWTEDERFVDRSNRMRNVEILEVALAEWFAVRTTEVAVDAMADAGVPCTSVNDIPQAAASPQLWERELLVEVPDPVAGTIHVSGKQIKLSRSEMVVGSAPLVGEHNDEILRTVLGYTPEEVERLRDDGVIS